MSDISVKRAHNMDLANAKEMTGRVVKDVKEAFPKLVSDINWNRDQTEASVKGRGFTGKFSVDATNIAIDIKLSMLTRPFKGSVETKVKAWMAKYIG